MSNPWARHDPFHASSLPQPLLDFLQQHITNNNNYNNALLGSFAPPVQLILAQLTRSADAVLAMTYPLLAAVLAPVADGLYALQRAQPELFGFAFFVLTVTAAVVVMGFVRRVLLWWTRMVMNLFFLGALVVLAAAVWENGVLESASAFFAWATNLAAWCAAMGRYFWAEWERYEKETAKATRYNR